ncbi:hypothetical protein BD289DRAFT_495446 [Coniella lustricola]|uniref:Nitrogen regulatory protein areA GATA-like domain-containing protein n=1 Tax=Coniella lustricola TaxID=2025994 RepID=A0A2T3AE11_9PEZI|nr:hypothetical protein BD289DRAFT_495446 [Coniella lustricola]
MAESLGEALALMLPPGLLFDSPAIYAEVAKLPIVPLEDVRRHWHTYTSMSKKSCDPTAYRLENFWWHVWGSDRRHLSGKTLARLWQDIASGPTAVPLRTPQWPFDLVANLTPSSSRPAPAHPILKKPRGPSTSGPRPTARFADVPDSEDEANQQSSGSQQSISEDELSIQDGQKVLDWQEICRIEYSPQAAARAATPRELTVFYWVGRVGHYLTRRERDKTKCPTKSPGGVPARRDACSKTSGIRFLGAP